ncbi:MULTISPECIES: DUF6049 family protein [unclassified Mycolicibacterium]|uniref:DUF6049 family protein n=1 Tax=unclassified Mycolicibacterium TaxID=2636767 RepID=UPI0012DCB1CD|nr:MULTISPECIES: DUF6049 family protein [unclassified Mycolicibacterium]MUL82932.1 hypothetical protein [Mycolicibacterium sp. CBMA 329]MUL89267.1 hypothetical protein [Mycolicibacterium sp. CBMA 331]MUL97833.1 hypothetical protein [Mycolicibacterium sp. CBMA 334]MUM29711.1 hypothetical protein [Mycolicibacterium sp. CBMA 295]MUM38783.1 hypothetical protein [Mycolicibacterium sp. CBMA 247]
MTAAPAVRRGLSLLARTVVLAVVVLMFSVWSTAALLPRASAGEPGALPFLQIRIDRVSPEVVTTTSDSVLTVSGTVLNVGDRPVRDVMIRMEHAKAVTSSSQLRTDLTGELDKFEPVADFVTVAPEMQRGESVGFTLSYPLRSEGVGSLHIQEPGVYPVLINVNGTPDYGAPARLDDARFLLPVLGVPADRPAGSTPDSTSAVDTLNAVIPPDTSHPVRMTMLWPLADRPRLAPGAPGGTTPVRLVDDSLAASLAPGGRLDTLLSAADFATGPTVDSGGQMRTALCLAVDPDLLVTVNAMTGGYVVNDGPDTGPRTPTRPGTGQEAAVGWLNRLRALAGRLCVAPTNYAQADLTALQRVGDPGLSAIATNGAGDIVDQILGVSSIRGASILADGPLTRPALDLLAAQGRTVAIAAAHIAAQDSATGAPATADVTALRYRPEVVAAGFDPAVGAALAGAGTDPVAPSYLDPSLAIPVRHDSQTARRQDALGALLWRGLTPAEVPRTQILMPPLVWSLDADDAQAILTTVATTIHAGLATPRPLPTVIAESNAMPPEPLAPPPPDSLGNPHSAIDENINSGIAAVMTRLWGLTAALTTDERTGLTGMQYTAPLREDMLRALSQSVPPEAREGLADQRLQTVSRSVNDMFGAVTIVNPGGAYTLATERSPLPLALRNDLPVPVRVRLHVDAPPGMTVTDLGEIELPPGYLPLRVPIEVHFTQRVAVDVSLQTADGLTLGDPVRLSVHSNAYGKVLFFITLSAGAVLVALAGRRLWHRFRGQPDRADLIPPGEHPDPLEVAIAFSNDEAPSTPAAPAPASSTPASSPTPSSGPEQPR